MIESIFLVYCEITDLQKRDKEVKTCSASELTKTTSNQKVSLKKLYLE